MLIDFIFIKEYWKKMNMVSQKKKKKKIKQHNK